MDELRLEFERMRLESHRKWEEFLMRLDFPLPELVPQGSVPEAPPAAPAAADLSETRELARAIDAAGNQVDALKAFLTACRRSCDRAVLLVSRGDALAVWKAEGFSPAEETALRNVTLAPSGHAELSAAMDGTPVTVGPNAPISALFASGARRALVCPIVVREKISAVLYADQRDEGSAFDPEGLALLSYLIGVAVDRLATRKLRPAPALTPIRSLAPSPAPAARPVPAPEPPPAMEIEEAAEAEPEEAPEPAPEPPAAPPSRGIDFDSTGHPYRPPAGVVPGGPRILRGPLAPVEEDPHDHARKIARLLVSDIRLYNEAAIEEGKRHNDIAARMRDDIDRARQTYNERVSDSVRATTDYFHEELVRSLADGNPDALGS